ncbi:heparinase II/III-family protein [Cnuibacter physcomitrellae]|uniref:heparinase II/III-family protein n=1 Tax=Cnuibacter physcomitrellae TaxID=1619308 RepID=UPI00217597B6|nr:heparinase II/III-family protein [Cnuibacter physcomitrellae]MCS5498924.1 heparinase II/III-family protein [Cnuibacter physcomitrellae]
MTRPRHPAPPGTHRGPLYALWGERMREPALRSTFAAVGMDRLRDRTGLPSSADRRVWEEADSATLDRIRHEAETERTNPWSDPTASLFARFVRDGDRTEYERAVDARQQRLTRATVLAAVTRADAWVDEAADGVVVLCEQSTWCLPAHDETHARTGDLLPDVSAPTLDLGAGEVAAQLAVADRLLGEDWDLRWPGLRARIRHEVETRVLVPFESRDDLWWLGYSREVNNWNPWILGNVLLAAVLLLDDADRFARLAARALESLDRYVATLPADGAIDEGVTYWWNGAARMLEALDLLSRVTLGGLDGAALPLVAELLRFPLRMQLGDDWYVNVGDGRARSRGGEPWQVAFHWGRVLDDRRVVDWARGARRPGHPVASATGGLPRLVRALVDASWREAVPSAPPYPRRVWLPSVQVLVCREREGDPSGLTLAVKGGDNGESHNHKDVGSFLVAVGGRPLLVDVGKPTYTAQTFSAGRYGIRAMQSGWHNVPAPHGLEQGEGRDVGARVEGLPPDGEPLVTAGVATGVDRSARAGVRLDLTGAYPLGEDERWLRSFDLVSESRIEVVDTWRLEPAGGAPAAFLHLVAAGDVRIVDDRVVVRSGDRAISISAGGVVPTLEEWRLDDPELMAVWGARLTRLRYPLQEPSGSVTTVVEAVS